MATKTGYDPFEENERLARKPLPPDPNFRLMKKKAVLKVESWQHHKDDTIEIYKKNADLEIKIKTWQDRKIARTSRCDLGHEHTVIQSDPLYFQIMHIPWDRAEALAKWILGMEESDHER